MIIKNKVFIATSMDGFIADQNGNLDWLHDIPNPDKLDMGYNNFMESVDAIIMGRTTFETVVGFDVEWPYTKPVFVLSNTLTELPKDQSDNNIFLIKGELTSVLNTIRRKGYNQLYIDGGKTIQNFLREDLIDELIITLIPKILGGGFRLFGEVSKILNFECQKTEHFSNNIVQNTFIRFR